MTRIHATFDGHVLQPEEASALVPNKRYLLTVEDDAPDSAPSGKYPLARIAEMAQDLGITDLAERHDYYAGKR
jgi:hypothetical protein